LIRRGSRKREDKEKKRIPGRKEEKGKRDRNLKRRTWEKERKRKKKGKNASTME